MPDGMFSIGELARRTGVSASTLRYWEQLGLVTPAERRSGQRRYTNEQVHRIGAIVTTQAAGFRLSEIGEILDAPPTRRRRLTQAKIASIEQRIRDAERARRVLTNSLRCDCRSLTTCDLLREAPAEDSVAVRS